MIEAGFAAALMTNCEEPIFSEAYSSGAQCILDVGRNLLRSVERLVEVAGEFSSDHVSYFRTTVAQDESGRHGELVIALQHLSDGLFPEKVLEIM